MARLSETALEDALSEWGREYRLDWVELLGHQGKNMLYDLIRFRGRIPRATGYAPLPTNRVADAIEAAVAELFTLNPKAATCLRLLYCGRGAVSAKAEIAGESLGEPVSKPSFKVMVRMAEMYVWGALNAAKS